MAMAGPDIERLIKQAFPDAQVIVVDLAGDGDHYGARVTSAAFAGKSRIQQHQMVYNALQGHMGGALHALVWGRDTSLENVTAFLQKVDADLLITGHIPCDLGFEAPNDRQLILDCMGTPACYCLFPADSSLTHAELVACVKSLEEPHAA